MFTTEELTLALLVIFCQLCRGVCVCVCVYTFIIYLMTDAFRMMTLWSVMSSYSLKMSDAINTIFLFTFLTAFSLLGSRG